MSGEDSVQLLSTTVHELSKEVCHLRESTIPFLPILCICLHDHVAVVLHLLFDTDNFGIHTDRGRKNIIAITLIAHKYEYIYLLPVYKYTVG